MVGVESSTPWSSMKHYRFYWGWMRVRLYLLNSLTNQNQNQPNILLPAPYHGSVLAMASLIL